MSVHTGDCLYICDLYNVRLMDLPNAFGNLKIDKWYKAIVYAGGIILVISLFVEVKGILTNTQVQLISAGLFCLGVGEWKNHKVQVSIKGYTVLQRPIRQADWVGRLFDFIGLVLIILGICSIVQVP